MSESVVDEVVSKRTASGPAPRAQIEEAVSTDGSVTQNSNAEEETVREGGVLGRKLSDSTKKLLEKLEAGKNADDADDADDVPADGEPIDPDDEGLVAPGEGEEPVETTDEGEKTVEEKAPVVDVWQEKATRLESANRELLARIDTMSKSPKSAPSPRIAALEAAEQAYVDEGPVAAIRKFISVVLDSKDDAKDVDAELAGLYTDLTARELNVPLEQSHLAFREAARARLALARDKRERKAQSDAATQKPEEGGEQPSEQAVTFIDNQLRAKSADGKVFADEFPMLMTMAEHLDGASPGKLLAAVIKREIQVGNLDPKQPDDVLIRTAAQRIEQHYQGLAAKFPKPKTNSDTTKSNGAKPATAATGSKDQRQPTQARTINNASASVAPATSPKTKKIEPQVEERPKFKSDKERRDWALRHLT